MQRFLTCLKWIVIVFCIYVVLLQILLKESRSEDDFSGVTKECPMGSAIMTNKNTKAIIDVDCISYNNLTHSWDTWIMDGKTKIKYYLPISEWEACTIEGRLYIDKNGKPKIKSHPLEINQLK